MSNIFSIILLQSLGGKLLMIGKNVKSVVDPHKN